MIFFTDFFNVSEEALETYGAFNISLINDLPLFIDPFLLFGSKEEKYNNLHKEILAYLTFLKTKSEDGHVTSAQQKSWYYFSEVKQNWLGYSTTGNGGSGLGKKFAEAMSQNMHIVYSDLNSENITSTTHLEKVCLFQLGVGKDNISDFTCNLIKYYLLEYTQTFAEKYLLPEQTKTINVAKAFFDYKFEKWMPKPFRLPFYNNDYIILTPVDLLTKDDNWINSNDLEGNFAGICSSIDNDQLRSEIHSYFSSQLPAPEIIGRGNNRKVKKPTKSEVSEAVSQTIRLYPDILNYYIKLKEGNKLQAQNLSHQKVLEVIELFRSNVTELIANLVHRTDFYKINSESSYTESMKRIMFMKDVIENKDGYRLFYHKGIPLKREADVQVIYRLTWYSSPYDLNREVNNGRGPVDYAASKGSNDKTLIEFKLASNGKLRMNLEHQVKTYERANNTTKSIKVILYFDNTELLKVNKILDDLNMAKDESIILIDAGNNKPSASNIQTLF
ncbi:hypothetical protein R1T16_14695 [Flavobacterium sp. DG1-102-2]|uniref:hypothetical protein n=1 Tax=Flavobacterium sp. DG1-102-2 TaxID=3081663 RepID=UPI0029498BE4|nr:hypothetical protein [Flavobacterium sp. DG1-102-2]MDV6169682.1 hypothetical protein [Flavobacterium sp. DG1-102-2]